MNLERANTPWWFRIAAPTALWHMHRNRKELYLTFDDGPTPGVTEFVLDQLKDYAAKATFFCLGNQVLRHPELFQRILSEGHSVGNHSRSHLNGWKTPTVKYLADVNQGATIIRDHSGFETRLFRPPFGRMRLGAMMRLSCYYQIVMWDSMSMDYRTDLDLAAVKQNVIGSGKPGSIILCHDSELAAPHLHGLLPYILDYYSQQGFSFARLNDGRSNG